MKFGQDTEIQCCRRVYLWDRRVVPHVFVAILLPFSLLFSKDPPLVCLSAFFRLHLAFPLSFPPSSFLSSPPPHDLLRFATFRIYFDTPSSNEQQTPRCQQHRRHLLAHDSCPQLLFGTNMICIRTHPYPPSSLPFLSFPLTFTPHVTSFSSSSSMFYLFFS